MDKEKTTDSKIHWLTPFSIKLADCILVFEQGNLRNSGSHTELYASDDLYRSLYDRQFIE
jgi:ABC-type multidrug transport system fused ATPase/permease subunit